MRYFSKKSVLKAYECLSRLSENPSLQGATQKVSAIRHFLLWICSFVRIIEIVILVI